MGEMADFGAQLPGGTSRIAQDRDRSGQHVDRAMSEMLILVCVSASVALAASPDNPITIPFRSRN